MGLLRQAAPDFMWRLLSAAAHPAADGKGADADVAVSPPVESASLEHTQARDNSGLASHFHKEAWKDCCMAWKMHQAATSGDPYTCRIC